MKKIHIIAFAILSSQSLLASDFSEVHTHNQVAVASPVSMVVGVACDQLVDHDTVHLIKSRIMQPISIPVIYPANTATEKEQVLMNQAATQAVENYELLVVPIIKDVAEEKFVEHYKKGLVDGAVVGTRAGRSDGFVNGAFFGVAAAYAVAHCTIS